MGFKKIKRKIGEKAENCDILSEILKGYQEQFELNYLLYNLYILIVGDWSWLIFGRLNHTVCLDRKYVSILLNKEFDNNTDHNRLKRFSTIFYHEGHEDKHIHYDGWQV